MLSYIVTGKLNEQVKRKIDYITYVLEDTGLYTKALKYNLD